MEYHSAIKKNEIMKFSGKWIELETPSLREEPRPRKTHITHSLSF